MEVRSDGEDDEPAVLSSSTLSILNDFLADRSKAQAASREDPFIEDWGMSQFWYTNDTAEKVADEVVRVCDEGKIACLACPSLFRKLEEKHPSAKAHLFEYDSRFEVLDNFHFWDYNNPKDLPPELHGSFKVVIADPPYLGLCKLKAEQSAECLSKSMEAMTLLADRQKDPIYFALTGASVRATAKTELGLRPVKWRPEHKSKLGNDFCFYTRNAETAERFEGWDPDFQ